MEEKKTELKMIKMSEVQSQEIEWLWYPFIPYGKLIIVQGDPGDGKTTLILNIAAKLSKGEGLDNDMKLTEPMNIIYQTAEDGLADTVKPRLEKTGADCERIVVIDESDKSLSMADERLEEAIIQTGARMLILDPIQAYLGGGMDMNRANEARDMTKRLGALAEKYKCAIILIGHMNKASGNKAAYRGMGSIDFFAVARSVLLVGRVEGEPNIRAVVQIKNNLAQFGHPKAFELMEARALQKHISDDPKAIEMITELIDKLPDIEVRGSLEKWQASILATQIDQFSYDYDTYQYRDTVEDREAQVANIMEDIRNGNTGYLNDFLNAVIAEGIRDGITDIFGQGTPPDDSEAVQTVRKAQELLDKLSAYKPLAKVEELEENNYNMIDNVLNNDSSQKEEKRVQGRISVKEKLAEKKAIIEQRDKDSKTMPEKDTEKKNQREI